MSTAAPAEIVQALAALEQTYHGPGGSDRRRGARIHLHAPLVVWPCLLDGILAEPLTVWLRDYSLRGLGLQHHQPMRPGEQFMVRLLRRPGQTVSIFCSIVRCEGRQPGPYSIGAQFSRILTGATTIRERDSEGVSVGWIGHALRQAQESISC